jgi:hypothetical protein
MGKERPASDGNGGSAPGWGGFVVVTTRTRERPTPRGHLFSEEREEFCCGLVGPFLGNEVTAVERAAA